MNEVCSGVNMVVYILNIPVISTLKTQKEEEFKNLHAIIWACCSERTAENPLMECVYE